MADLKVYVSDELEEEFKRASMEAFGYGRGSISKAAAEALQRWAAERLEISRNFSTPEDPVKAIRGMLRHVRESSVELQHSAKKVRARRALGA